MKNTLTVKQSRELVMKGLDPSRASYFEQVNDWKGVPQRVPIFMLPDLIQLLSEIKFEGYDFKIQYFSEYKIWRIGYHNRENPVWVKECVGNPELIDGLYYLTLWALRNKHI